MNVIELRGIGKTFTDRAEPTMALEDINLTISGGEFVSIIGPSGSGKSTLMNVLGLLDVPTSGEYLLDAHQVSSFRDRQLARLRREKIGFVFQSFNLIPRLNVLANVELPLIYAGVRARKRKNRALNLLKLVGLEDRANYRPNQISGGQTQRVAIARALANNPSLILADEPTGNLDTKSSAAIIDELRRLNRENGTTIVIVTHNPEVAQLTDRIVTVRDGRIVSDEHNKVTHLPAAATMSEPTSSTHDQAQPAHPAEDQPTPPVHQVPQPPGHRTAEPSRRDGHSLDPLSGEHPRTHKENHS